MREKNTDGAYTSIISHCNFFINSSAFIGSTFNVYNLLAVRSFNFTMSFDLFTAQYSARSLISINSSGSNISAGKAINLLALFRLRLDVFICFGFITMFVI